MVVCTYQDIGFVEQFQDAVFVFGVGTEGRPTEPLTVIAVSRGDEQPPSTVFSVYYVCSRCDYPLKTWQDVHNHIGGKDLRAWTR